MPSAPKLSVLLAIVCALVLSASAAGAEPTRYPEGMVHSPMTASVVARLKRVLASSNGAKDAFVKIGDSNTANPAFMSCFAGDDVKLGEHAELETTRRFFAARRVDASRTSFDRTSESATIGWLAGQVLGGSFSPLAREIGAVKPAFAIVMLGTNDDRPNGVETFAKNITEVVDRALALGVVPLLSTLPPRDDSRAASARIPEMNRILRQLAESRQIPLMDLHAALIPLPKHGLLSDGIHLASVWKNEAPHACWLTGDALQRGMNTRNLVTLTALDRARRFLIENETPEPDAAPAS